MRRKGNVSILTSFLRSWAYSMSSSWRVSMCSLMKAMGTITKFLIPFFAYPFIASSVCGLNHGSGPTLDCQTSLYGYLNFNCFITASTVEATSAGYVSPRFTTCSDDEKEVGRVRNVFSHSWLSSLSPIFSLLLDYMPKENGEVVEG